MDQIKQVKQTELNSLPLKNEKLENFSIKQLSSSLSTSQNYELNKFNQCYEKGTKEFINNHFVTSDNSKNNPIYHYNKNQQYNYPIPNHFNHKFNDLNKNLFLGQNFELKNHQNYLLNESNVANNLEKKVLSSLSEHSEFSLNNKNFPKSLQTNHKSAFKPVRRKYSVYSFDNKIMNNVEFNDAYNKKLKKDNEVISNENFILSPENDEKKNFFDKSYDMKQQAYLDRSNESIYLQENKKEINFVSLDLNQLNNYNEASNNYLQNKEKINKETDIGQYINKIISENEAIVETNNMKLPKRNFLRNSTNNCPLNLKNKKILPNYRCNRSVSEFYSDYQKKIFHNSPKLESALRGNNVSRVYLNADCIPISNNQNANTHSSSSLTSFNQKNSNSLANLSIDDDLKKKFDLNFIDVNSCLVENFLSTKKPTIKITPPSCETDTQKLMKNSNSEISIFNDFHPKNLIKAKEEVSFNNSNSDTDIEEKQLAAKNIEKCDLKNRNEQEELSCLVYVCTICNIAFRNKETLSAHQTHYCKNNLNVQQSSKSYFEFTENNKKEDSIKNQLLHPNYSGNLSKKRKISEPAFLSSNFKKNLIFLKEDSEKNNFKNAKDMSSSSFENTLPSSLNKNTSVHFTNFKTDFQNETIARKISVLHQANNQYFITIKKPLISYKKTFDHTQIPGLPSQIDEKMFNKSDFISSLKNSEQDKTENITQNKVEEDDKKLNLDEILNSFFSISSQNILEKTKRYSIISEYLPHFDTKITLKGNLVFNVLKEAVKNKNQNVDFIYSETNDIDSNFNENKIYQTKQVSSMPKFFFEDSLDQKSSQTNLMNLNFQTKNEDVSKRIDENNNEYLISNKKLLFNFEKEIFREDLSTKNEKTSNSSISNNLEQKSIENRKKNFNFDKPFTKLICSNLVSPDTPRSEKNFIQSITNGQVTTFLNLKKSTRVTFCCIYRAQPMFIEQSLQPKLSMYSNWQIFPPYENLLSEFKASVLLGCLDSRQWKHRVYNSTLVFIKNNSSCFEKVKNKNLMKNSIMEKYFEKINHTDELCTTVCSLNWMIKKYKQDCFMFRNELKEFKKNFCDESYDFTERLLKRRHRKLSKKNNEELSSLINNQFDGFIRSTSRKQSSTKVPKRIFIFEGGFKSNEDYTYIRGRGKGKYVCVECGIRCKKPSMLRKHIRTHTDLRPYKCSHCNFAFKTKGNLTKHMKSKAHHKKCAELGINPVPTLIDALTQIDTKALALQEAMEQASNNYLNENYKNDLTKNIFEDDEDDGDELFDDDHLVNDEIDDEQLDAKFGVDDEDEEEEEDEEYVQRLNGVNLHLHFLKLKILSDSCSLNKKFFCPSSEKNDSNNKYLDVDISFLTNYRHLGSFNDVIVPNSNIINKDKKLNKFCTYLEAYNSIKATYEKKDLNFDNEIFSKNFSSPSVFELKDDTQKGNEIKNNIIKENFSSIETVQISSYSENIKPNLKHKNNLIYSHNLLGCINEEDNKIFSSSTNVKNLKKNEETSSRNLEKVSNKNKDFLEVKKSNVLENLNSTNIDQVKNQKILTDKKINDNSTNLSIQADSSNYFHKKLLCKSLNLDKTNKDSLQHSLPKINANKAESDFLDFPDKSLKDYISLDENQLAVGFSKNFEKTLDSFSKYENKINALTTGEIQKNVTNLTEGGDLNNQQVVLKESYSTDDVLDFNKNNLSTKIRENSFSFKKSSLSDISTNSRKLNLNCINNNFSLNSEVLEYLDVKNSENIRSKSLPPSNETNKNQLDQKRSKSVFSMKVNETDEHEVACSLLSLSENWENKNNLNYKKLCLSLPLKRKYSNYMKLNKVYNTLEKKSNFMENEIKSHNFENLNYVKLKEQKNETQIKNNLDFSKIEKPVNLSKKYVESFECENLKNKPRSSDDSTDSTNSEENQYNFFDEEQRQIRLRKISIHIQNTIDKHEKILNYGSLPANNLNSSPTNKQPIDQSKTNICNICNKTFSEESQLRLHENIHFFERPFRCDVCSVSFRSQGHLMKHQRSLSHLNKLNMNSTFGQPSIDNPRPFKCTDCKSGYRIHGHLAKHLRSKIHIGKLESLGKLPPGLYSLMERNQIQLNDLDTTDCETSFQCLLKLSQRLQANGDLPSSLSYETKSLDKKFYSDKNIKTENLSDQKNNMNLNKATKDLNNQVYMVNNILYETPNDQYFNLKNKYFFKNYSPHQSIDPSYINNLTPINVDLLNNLPRNNFFKHIDNFSHFIPQQQFFHQNNHPHHLYPRNNFEVLPHGHPVPEIKINEQKTTFYNSLEESNESLTNNNTNVQVIDKKATNDYTSSKTKPLSSIIASTRSNTCSICNQVFKSAKFLQVHLYSDHINSQLNIKNNETKNDIKKFECKICSNKYDDAENYEVHLTSHLIPRPFVCDYCDAGFTNIDFLNSHLKTHTKI